MFEFGRVEMPKRDMGYIARFFFDSMPWEGFSDHIWPPLQKEYCAVSRRLCQDYRERGAGQLYAVAQGGLHALTEATEWRKKEFFGDDGLPWDHFRLEGYVPPFSYANEANVRGALADNGSWSSQLIPDSDGVAAVLREGQFAAVLLIHPNTEYSFARIVRRIRGGGKEFLPDLKFRKDGVGHFDRKPFDPIIETEPRYMISGELEPHYYAWREGEVLVIDRGELDQPNW